MDIMMGLFMFFVGAITASFSLLLARRLVIKNERRKSVFRKSDLDLKGIFFGRSKCEYCGETLGFFDLIPIISWFILRGRCRHCHQPIGSRSPIYETLGGILVWSFWFFYANPWISLCSVVLVMGLVIVSETDIETLTIPDFANVMILGSGLAYHAILPKTDVIDAIFAALAGFTIFFVLDRLFTRIIMGRNASHYRFIIGFGDIKLFGALSAWCGLAFFGYIPVIAAILGAFWALWNQVPRKSWIPYGAFLAMSHVILMVFVNPFFVS